MAFFRSLLSRFAAGSAPHDGRGREGYEPASSDTMAAINELSLVVKNNPDAVEIYLALGNLYRSHGEIERAVQIRNNLIVRPGLDSRFKARAWYELGRDYKRGGFVDRALRAFEEAGKLWGDNDAITSELALLSADSGDYERAARFYNTLKNARAEAHYQVRLAQAAFARGDDGLGRKWVAKALKVYPGSVEAWLARIEQAFHNEEWDAIRTLLRDGMDRVAPQLRFLLMEGLLRTIKGADLESLAMVAMHRPVAPKADPEIISLPSYDDVFVPVSPENDFPNATEPDRQLCRVVLPVLENQPPDLLLEYYGAWVLMMCGDYDRARSWLEKTLVLKPGFWPARLELLALSMSDQPLSPVFKVQMEFFVSQARQVKRFVCRSCGLKREQIFFTCQRCHSWHSIAFRAVLTD